MPIIFLLLLLVNAGLAVWWWNQRHSRPVGYGPINLAAAPAPAEPSASPAPATGASLTSLADPSRNFIKDPELSFRGSPAAPPRAARADKAAGGPAGSNDPNDARPQTRQLVAAASKEYFKLKKDPYFKSSPVIQAWSKDFRAYPDLRAIDERYNRDKDAVRFLVMMVRSPNFKFMLDQYFQTPDVQAFMKTLSASPVVMAGARSFLADFNMPAAVSRYTAAATSSALQAPPPQGAEAVDRLKGNPAVRQYLDRQGGQAVPMGE